jgi:hypothetical protein
VVEGGTDLCPEDPRQGLDRDEIVARLRRNPRGAISGEPPGGDEQMDVRMIEQGARPGMEDRETAEAASHIPRIAREREKGRRGALHQQPVDGFLVGSRERPQLIRQGEGE